MTRKTIGALAEATGVKIPTIRYYEAVGLLPKPVRSTGNRRLYGAEAIKRLRFIRHARELGFEVAAIRQLLDMSGQPDQSCEQADMLARQHLEEIDSRIIRLKALRGEIGRMLEQCQHGHIGECRVIEVLADHAHCRHTQH